MADSTLTLLNDHCWLEIFEYLSLEDLANFKEVLGNGSVGDAADMGFSKKTRGSFRFGYGVNLDTALQIIKQFGSSIFDLTVCNASFSKTKWTEIFRVVNEHCKDNLRKLTLRGDAVGIIQKADISLIVDVLKNVKALELINDHVAAGDFIEIISHCENAESVTLSNIARIDVREMVFPNNLLKLKWIGPMTDNDLKTILDKLKNTRLEDFTLRICNMIKVDVRLSHLLGLERLKTLCIAYDQADQLNYFLRNIKALSSLNALSLSGKGVMAKDQLCQTYIEWIGRTSRLKLFKLNGFSIDDFESTLLALCENEYLEHLVLLCHSEPKITSQTLMKIIDRRKELNTGKCLHLCLGKKLFTSEYLNAKSSNYFENHKETLKLIDECDRSYEYHKFDEAST